MAKRIHVFAFRDTPPDAVHGAMANLGEIEVHEENGWSWFSTSVWGVGSDKILESLKELDGPLLFVTTEDACRWYLRLRGGRQVPYLTVHEMPAGQRIEGDRDYEDYDVFHDEYEDDSDEDSVGITLGAPPVPKSELPTIEFRDPFFEPYRDYDEDEDDDEFFGDTSLERLCAAYAELGLPLDEALVARLRDLPDDEVYEAFCLLHAVEIVEALERFEIPHVRQAVLDTLTGRSVTSVEADWDIGNLPRFLSDLGFGGYFDNMVEEAEGEAKAFAEREPENYARPIIEAVANVGVQPLSGGALFIPMGDAPLLFRAGYYTHEEVEAAFTAQLPKEGVFAPADRAPTYLSVHERNGQLEIGISMRDVFLAPTSCDKLAALLGELPNDTALTLHLQSEKSLSQQFRGTIHGRQWSIESATVLLSANELAAAIAFFRAGLAKSPLVAEDDAEAKAILMAAKEDYTLHDIDLAREGLALGVPPRYLNSLATLFFRRRFGHLWDCSAALSENDEALTRWREIKEDLSEAERLPISGTPIHEGRASKFYEADLEASVLDEGMVSEIANLPALCESLGSLGFLHLGNLVCEKVGGCILCAFASEEEHAFAIHYIMPGGMTWKDCFTQYVDGTSLTTTNSAMFEGSIPQLRILEHRSESPDFLDLLTDHRKGRAILKGHGFEEIVIISAPEGVARAIDDFLFKRLADE